MEEIRRVAAAIGLTDFQYYAIPAAVLEPVLEVADPLLSASVLVVGTDEKIKIAAVAPPEPQRIGLSIVRSITSPVAPARPTRPFLLLADVATAVACVRSVQHLTGCNATPEDAPDAMPWRAQSGGRAAGRR